MLVLLAVSGMAVAEPAAQGQEGVAGLSRQEALRLGEQMYRNGVLPSGEPLKALVQGDIPVDGTVFTCVSCHMRGGFGSFEGGVLTTPTTGKYLYQPVFNLRQLSPAEKKTIPRYFQPLTEAPPIRPAYTDATLLVALRGGIDPAGRRLNKAMPRYFLDDRDSAILIYYLKSLGSEQPPGVTETTVRFATVLTDDVPPEERDALVATLENYAQGRNVMAESSDVRSKRGFSAEWMDFAYRRKLSIVRWDLKGPPETWRGQLEEYNRKEPVFALLGGMTNGEWRPIHEFSEEHRIPCILPITDLPVISETDWYTIYFSKGLYQEGEAAAGYLAKTMALPPDKTVVQVFSDSSEGRALAEGFRKTWHDLDRLPPVEKVIRKGEPFTKDAMHRLLEKEKPSVLLVWLGNEAVPALEAIASDGNRPEMVYVSTGLLKNDLGKLPDNVRDTTYITYPYALQVAGKLLNAGRAAAIPAKGKNMPPDQRISSGTWSLWLVLNNALMMLGTNFYRDNLFDKIDCIQDKPYPYTDYERLSFGPGQRYAAKGCYIVQMTHGPKPELVKKSDWVIH
jgi:ABC-type branched-subunit amino acid transport system substrate-binding protein